MSWVSSQKPWLSSKGRCFCNTEHFVPLAVLGLSSNSVLVRPLHRHRTTRQVHLQVQHQSEVTNKWKEGHQSSRERPVAIFQKREGITESLRYRSACTRTHSFLRTQIRNVLRKWPLERTVFTHFLNDRNCEVCLRTWMTRAPCRIRTSEAVLRGENFGDLVGADHTVLSEWCESRNNHGYAVVVQDQATQWIQSYPCKNKNFPGDGKELPKFFESTEKPTVVYTDMESSNINTSSIRDERYCW